jgi:hypothetical protein
MLGMVKSIETRTYRAGLDSSKNVVKGEISHSHSKNSFEEFNRYGNKIKQKVYTRDSNFDYKQNFKYDNANRLVAIHSFNMDETKQTRQEKIGYNRRGQKNIVKSDDLKFSITYNKFGMREEVVTTVGRKFYKRITYQYDSLDALKLETTYNYENIKSRSTKYIISESKTFIEKWEYDKRDTLQEYYSCLKNNLGVILKENKWGSEHLYIYKYDSIGNWTEALIKINGTPSKIIQRELVYFSAPKYLKNEKADSCFHELMFNNHSTYCFYCGRAGIDSDNLRLFSFLISNRRFDLIEQLAFSEIPSTSYLGAEILLFAFKKKLWNRNSQVDFKINALRGSKEKVYFDSGCVQMGNNYSIKSLLAREKEAHYYKSIKRWIKSHY